MPDGEIGFSLIVATLGRTTQLRRLLESLEAQTHQLFETIVVDQNPSGFLAPIIGEFSGRLRITHLNCEKGLSRARNAGLQLASGDAIAFPDDDCWYPPNLLRSVAGEFSRHPEWDGITGQPADPDDPRAYPWYHRTSGAIDRINLWRRSTSFAIFLRSSVVRTIGKFDERLGLGATSGMIAAEEGDYLIRALDNRFRLQYCAGVRVHHSGYGPSYGYERARRAQGYSKGFGHVLKKHGYPFWFVLHTWLRALGGAAVSALKGNGPKARYHYFVLKGRIAGWLT